MRSWQVFYPASGYVMATTRKANTAQCAAEEGIQQLATRHSNSGDMQDLFARGGSAYVRVVDDAERESFWHVEVEVVRHFTGEEVSREDAEKAACR